MHRKPNENLHLSEKRIALLNLRPFIAFSLVFLFANVSFAQVDRSGLSGTITESSGRLLPQAHVTVVENATGLRRETVSGVGGNYRFPDCRWAFIPFPSSTRVSRSLSLSMWRRSSAGRATWMRRCEVAGGEERVNVSSASALMDHNTSAVTGLIERTQADELPLNGRDWSELTAFVPGAIDTGGGNQRSVRFAGRGLDDSNFTYDGVDATNIVNQTQRPGCGSPFRWTRSRSSASTR
jgi:hypothetical protein